MGIPANALALIPVLLLELSSLWPSMREPSVLMAQVEQETCASLKSPKCWSPHAELKTSREYGFGLGQITVTERFNVFEDVRKMHPTLRSWEWEDRYDPQRQLRALVLMDMKCWSPFGFAATEHDRYAMMLAAYNGGAGGLLRDRTMCTNTPGCDDRRWWGHIEKHSWRAKKPTKGYGKSFFEINREYPRNILYLRRDKYRTYDGGG